MMNQNKILKNADFLGWTLRIIAVFSLMVFLVVPFCTKLNGCLAKWLWWPSAAVILFFSLCGVSEKSKDDKNMANNDLVYLVGAFVVFGSWFIINFYDTKYDWRWFIFVCILVLLPMGSWLLLDYINQQKGYDDKIVNSNKKVHIKACIYFALGALFYLSFLIDNLTFRFIFGGMAALYLFYNIVYSFLNVKSISNNAVGLIIDLMVGMSLLVYLIYIIPNGTNSLQSIILSIVGTICAGFIPLVGVAWTLKHTEKLRNEENKLKIKPVFYYLEEEKDLSREIVYVSVFSDEEKDGCDFYCGQYKNTENGILIMKCIIVGNERYDIYMNKVIEKNRVFIIGLQSRNKQIDMRDFTLQVEDIEGNEYSFRITLEHNDYRKIVEIK